MKTKHVMDLKVTIPSALEPSFAYIWSADLRKVALRLKKEHPFWPMAKIEALTLEYRKFLSLILLSGKEIPMCNELVDEVWHAHLLFTQDYASFCEQAFGGFLHHEPVGVGTREGLTSADFFTEYRKVFGEPASVWFGSLWARLFRGVGIPLRLCTASGTAKICYPSGPAKICQSTGPAKLCTASKPVTA